MLPFVDTVTFNSFSQLDRYYPYAKNMNKDIGIRINIENSVVGTSMYNPCSRFSRLGVTLREFDESKLEMVSGFWSIHYVKMELMNLSRSSLN